MTIIHKIAIALIAIGTLGVIYGAIRAGVQGGFDGIGIDIAAGIVQMAGLVLFVFSLMLRRN